MAEYTLKELESMSTEELIVSLMLTSDSTTKTVRKKEEKIVKILAARKVINEQTMKNLLERKNIW